MIYILLPIYNEQERLPLLIEKLDRGMKRRGYQYRIIAYNDGSKDASLEVLSRFKESLPITVLSEGENKGLGVALKSMLDKTLELSSDKEDVAVVLDADDTHNPEHIYHMVNKIRDGFDMVVASRYLPDSRVVGVTMTRQFFSKGASWLMRVLFPIKGVKDYTCGYRAYTIDCLRRAYKKFGDGLIQEKGFACMVELILKLRSLNIIVVEVPIILRYDQKYGKSKMKIFKTIRRTLLLLYNLMRF